MELSLMDQSEHENHDLPLDDVEIRSDWVVIGEAENRTIAEFAVNGLRSYDIPAVLDSRPGFLGSAGLALRSMRTGKIEMFKILVPREYQDEATEMVKIFLGGKTESNSENEDPTVGES
jgi:hypothetical protein